MAEKIKVCNFDKKIEKKKFKKAFACPKERFFYQKKRTKDQKILRKSMRKHIDKQKMKGWQRRSKFATLIKKTEKKNKKELKKVFACQKVN